MTMFRWASELAIAPEPDKQRLGLQQLQQLGESQQLNDPVQPLIDAALRTLIQAPISGIHQTGSEADVVQIPGGLFGPLEGDDNIQGGKTDGND